MGFWSSWFGKKKKRPTVSRDSAAVRRLAKRRGVGVWELDLFDLLVIDELLQLGLVLSDDGSDYVDDYNWVDPEASTEVDPYELSDEPEATTEETTETATVVEAATETVTEPEPVVDVDVPTPEASSFLGTTEPTVESPSDFGGGVGSGNSDFGSSVSSGDDFRSSGGGFNSGGSDFGGGGGGGGGGGDSGGGGGGGGGDD